jgi:hypothetical protein
MQGEEINKRFKMDTEIEVTADLVMHHFKGQRSE